MEHCCRSCENGNEHGWVLTANVQVRGAGALTYKNNAEDCPASSGMAVMQEIHIFHHRNNSVEFLINGDRYISECPPTICHLDGLFADGLPYKIETYKCKEVKNEKILRQDT